MGNRAGGVEIINYNPKTVEKEKLIGEAKYVLRLPFAERRPYLNMVQSKRGIEARKKLEAEIKKQFKKDLQ